MLVGRVAEQRVLDALVAGARLGRSGVLVLTGEAGIGKTALLRHVCDSAADLRLVQAECHESERDIPFGGLAQLLRASEKDLDRIPPPQAHALGVALAMREGSVVDRLAVGAAVLGLLVRWSEERPLAVVVDDAHHLDQPSAEALTFACRRLLADPVAAVFAARTGEGVITRSGLPELAVTGLDAAATAELALTRRPAPPGGTAGLHRLTGGNPLAVLELARLAPPAADVEEIPVPVPQVLAERYAARVDSLDPDTRTLLVVAAITGGDLRVVEATATALGVHLAALEPAERAGLVTVGAEQIAFAHPLVRAAVYALAHPGDRRRLHAAVAAALPAADADRRAWHLAAAVLGTDDDVANAMVAAGERARRRGAHAVASTAFERAATLTLDPLIRAGRLVTAGEAAWSGGDGGRAVELADRAVALDGSATCRGAALGLRGEVAAREGSLVDAREMLTEAAEHLRRSDPSRAVLLLAGAANACYLQGTPPAAMQIALLVEDLVAAHELTPAALAVGTMAAGMARVLAGDGGIEQIRVATRLLEFVDDRDGVVSPWWLMMGPLWLRESGAARTLVRAALDERRERSAIAAIPGLLFAIARDGATTDRWVPAEADYGEAIALARELGHTTELAISLAGLAWLEARTGRAKECSEHAAEVLTICERRPVTTARVWAQFALGEAALASGDAATAVTRLQALSRLLDEIDLRDPDVSPAPDLAEALLRAGREPDARALTRGFETRAEAKGQPWARARAVRMRLLLGDGDTDASAAAALALHARTPDVFEEARTRLVIGARLRRERRRADAREPLRDALAAFRMLGARPWADAAARELDATGETVARSGAQAREHLTARELQIALLLAEGRTTREAAAALFLSPKTVEYHLRHVYTKLDISSRSELRERLKGATG